jgi:hypothetical protein
MTISMPLKSASATGDNPLPRRAVVAPLITPTKDMTISMPLKKASVAGDNLHFGGG